MNVSDIITESHHACPHCGGPLVEYSGLMEKKDACYYKVKAGAKVWPSAYASGRLVQCRKKGAANWGNKSEGVAEGSSNAVTFFRGEPILSQERLNQLKSSIGKPYPILRKEGVAANIGTYMSPDGDKATSFVKQALAGQGKGGVVTQIQVNPNSFSKGDGGIDEAVIITNIAGLVSNQTPNKNDPLRIQDRKQAMLKYLGPGVKKYLNDPLLSDPKIVQSWYNPEFAQKNWNTINSGKQAVIKPGESNMQERMMRILGPLAENIRRDPEVISYFISHNPGDWVEYNFRMNSDGSGTKVVDVKYYPPAKQGVAEGSEQISEYRDRLLQYVKSLLPTWPEYVLKDWLVPNKGNFSNLPADAVKNGIMEKIQLANLSVNTKWQLVPNMKFTMGMFEPMSKQRLIGRAGGNSDMGLDVPRDKERHATQAALAQQQGGVRKEPVLLIKTDKGYELLEGWHRTIQHFAKYPDGYTGPAYVAVAQQGVAEGLTEYKNTPLQDYNGLQFMIDSNHPYLRVKAFAPGSGQQLAQVDFKIDDQDELHPEDLHVEERWRGQGIAQIMYDFVKSKGYTIHRSWSQTDAGAGFWDKHRGEERVWEQGVAEAQLDEKCWDGYQQQGMKNKSGRQVPNCVPVEEELTMEQQFDLIEDMVESLAQAHGVDSEQIWEDFESVDDHELFETAAWRRKEGKSAKGGLNAKGVASYRRENPGSKLQMAVTTKPSKLKPGSKAAKRRKSFCARMSGVKGPMKKPNGKPTRKALALRKWNC